MSIRQVFCVILSLSVFLGMCYIATAKSVPADAETPNQQALEENELKEWNDQIRRDKFDIILPKAMKKNNVDMWIYVMRDAIPDPFGAGEFGFTSGVFIFTDRGGDRIERASLGRRWGGSQRRRGKDMSKVIEETKAYDIIGDPVFVKEPLAIPETEYDYRFKGLRAFVEERDPKRIALNYKDKLGPWATTKRSYDGISHTDYRLLTEEIGDKYAKRIVSGEYMMMDYITRKVPSEIKLLKRIREDKLRVIKKTFAEIVPGVTKNGDVGLTLFRRRSPGISQRGWSPPGYRNVVIQGGDIVGSPSQGFYAYVLPKGETKPSLEIKKLWAQYLKVDKILAETVKAGVTPREIIKNFTRKFDEAGIVIRDDQLHMSQPRNDFAAYSKDFDPKKSHLSIDSHGMGKGAREKPYENYFGPRMGTYGPDWTLDIPLPPNHHFVIEYFLYMPSPSSEGKSPYLLFWDHEQALANESGIQYLSPPQKELYLIKYK